MKLHQAKHYGMCFGVRDALRATHQAALHEPITTLGQLVHNPEVDRHLQALGVKQGALNQTEPVPTQRVVITAHGASDQARLDWAARGHDITDTTCPLVRKAHDALRTLVNEGYSPVVIGQQSHVEVQGLIGDFPGASVVLSEQDVEHLPQALHLGVISQTTQPLLKVLGLVETIKRARPNSEVRFVDTICHPTKQRQKALEELCAVCEVIVVVGGRNSNNTRQLVESVRAHGVVAHQVERAEDLEACWFRDAENVGLTAGTSTLDETVEAVRAAIQRLAAQPG
jgi:4-hydroxy-3-methylbut-2-en-1-yl diphosphate reductase